MVGQTWLLQLTVSPMPKESPMEPVRTSVDSQPLSEDVQVPDNSLMAVDAPAWQDTPALEDTPTLEDTPALSGTPTVEGSVISDQR